MMRPSHSGRVRTLRTSTLIVTEGSQTEPNYFDALARDRGLTSLNIPRNHITDPVSLVREGRNALKRDRTIERAYVIFDTFEHQNYRDALGLCDNYAQSGIPIRAVPSYPCFEYWLLLHFDILVPQWVERMLCVGYVGSARAMTNPVWNAWTSL